MEVEVSELSKLPLTSTLSSW